MRSDPFKSAGLDALCSEEHRELLDAVQSLSSQGIRHHISPPQIVVCGDESCGKSSVLEALSGVPFPVQSRFGTRFAIKLILRRTWSSGTSVSILPDDTRTEDDRTFLSKFDEQLESFDDIPRIVARAKGAMTLKRYQMFFRDVLRIEIWGPDRPHVTIVDLPGLADGKCKFHANSDRDAIKDIVKSYMARPRSIILATVSAKANCASQTVLNLAQKADPRGQRTVGIITKPDTLRSGSRDEDMHIFLALNEVFKIPLGWHVLRNIGSGAKSWTLDELDKDEMEFFSKGSWQCFPKLMLGAQCLRGKLSKLLYSRATAEVPSLIQKIELKSTQCRLELDKLASKLFQLLIREAIEGTYRSAFFELPLSETGYQKRLRAVVQTLGSEFCYEISSRGQLFRVATESSTKDGLSGNLVTRDKFVDMIVELMRESQGRDLPGMFSPTIVSDLFKMQTLPWEEIATSYAIKSWKAVRCFTKHLVFHVFDCSTLQGIMRRVVQPQLDEILANVQTKTKELLDSHRKLQSITFNSAFNNALNQTRRERQSSEIAHILRDFFGPDVSFEPGARPFLKCVDVRNLHARLVEQMETDITRCTASIALEYMEVYYELALKRFVEEIFTQVVETNVISKLKTIFSPLTVETLSDTQVAEIAGETEETRSLRTSLNKQAKVLDAGMRICMKHRPFASSGTVHCTIDSFCHGLAF